MAPSGMQELSQGAVSSAIAVLGNKDLLSLIVQHVDEKESRLVRLLCSSTRCAHDQIMDKLMVQSQKGMRNAKILEAAAGFVCRGCQPETIEVFLQGEALAQLQDLALQFFKVQHAPLPTSVLALCPANLLTRELAGALVDVLPQLSELRLEGFKHGQDPEPARTALAYLMGGEGSPCQGHCDDSRPRSPLPNLTSIELSGEVPPCVIEALQNCSQLRGLDLAVHQSGWAPEPMNSMAVQQVAQLKQLRSLVLHRAVLSDIQCVLQSVTGLTRLSLESIDRGCVLTEDSDVLPTSLFTSLRQLRDLDLEVMDLDIRGLDRLTALTSLSVGSLSLSDSRTRERVQLRTSPSWPLPPRLRSLLLAGSSHCVDVLGCLRLPSCLTYMEYESDELELELFCGLHTSQKGRLSRAMLEALANTFRLLGRCKRAPEDVMNFRVRVEFDDDNLMHPPPSRGSAAERLHHVPWLEALLRLGPKEVELYNVRLSSRDVHCISKMASLEVLSVNNVLPSIPVKALPLLARLPRLSRLEVTTRSLQTGTRQEIAEALRRLCATTKSADLQIQLDPGDDSDDGDDDDVSDSGDSNRSREHDSDDDGDQGSGADTEEDEAYDEGPRRAAARKLVSRVSSLLDGIGLDPSMVELKPYARPWL